MQRARARVLTVDRLMHRVLLSGAVLISAMALASTVADAAKNKRQTGVPAWAREARMNPDYRPTSAMAAKLFGIDAELLRVTSELRTLAAVRDPELENGDRRDLDALQKFYESRGYKPLWVDAERVRVEAGVIADEIRNAAAYGLNPAAFALPANIDREHPSPRTLAETEYALNVAILKYARHARGGRIAHPSKMLNSNLDRKPQLHKRADVLARMVEASDVRAALVGLHPVHPQFERLRQAFLKASGDGNGGGRLNAAAKRLRTNMEFWRWMWSDLGELYIFNNIPEFMQRVVRDGEVIRSERIVVGLVNKQSSVYSRQLKEVVLRPQWRVPESIMVHELWPSLLRGGGYMRQYGLNITTKSGEPRDWRKIDWTKDDIRNYHVWQPPGPKSVLGRVKFSFPSQHTIFMHDTPDKWMLRSRKRALSHGCLRLANPMQLAEIVLDYDKGWDAKKIEKLARSGPLNNAVQIDKRLPVHLAYFTAWVDDNGKLRMFPDLYGHEKRVTLALDGAWDKIDKGRNHLAPVKPRFDPEKVARTPARSKRRQPADSVADIVGDVFGGLY